VFLGNVVPIKKIKNSNQNPSLCQRKNGLDLLPIPQHTPPKTLFNLWMPVSFKGIGEGRTGPTPKPNGQPKVANHQVVPGPCRNS